MSEDKPQQEAVKADEVESPVEETAVAEGADAPAETTEEIEEIEVVEVEEAEYVAKAKPQLDDETKAALALRAQKQKQNPEFRRQEWFRYKKLGGKNAGWRAPRGMHSKMRMGLKYRPNKVRIGYRNNAVARGLHASGFEEVLVYRPEDLDELDIKTQGARIGGTVGGRKAAAIVAKADELGIRVFNRGGN